MLEPRNFDFKIWTKSVWERVTDLDDPRRCQAVLPTVGQCLNKAVENSNFCYAHGGNRAVAAKKKKDMDNFRLNQYKERAEEFNSDDKIASLKGEIAILRILIEERFNRCTSQQELLLSSGPLSDLVMKSAALVEKCQKIDMKLNNLLDRSKVIQFAQVIIEIISKNVNEEILESVSTEINEALENL